MRGHREDARRKRLETEHRCVECADMLPFDAIGRFLYCPTCRAKTEGEVWRLYCEGDQLKDIATHVRRPPSEVHKIVKRLEAEQEDTSTFAHDDGIPRCKCGLRIDKDHLVCDLYGAASFASNRRGGPTYPGNG